MIRCAPYQEKPGDQPHSLEQTRTILRTEAGGRDKGIMGGMTISPLEILPCLSAATIAAFVLSLVGLERASANVVAVMNGGALGHELNPAIVA